MEGSARMKDYSNFRDSQITEIQLIAEIRLSEFIKENWKNLIWICLNYNLNNSVIKEFSYILYILYIK